MTNTYRNLCHARQSRNDEMTHAHQLHDRSLLRSKDGEIFSIRRATLDDIPMINKVCLMTGDGAGGDATVGGQSKRSLC
jgi:hypothetical protein